MENKFEKLLGFKMNEYLKAKDKYVLEQREFQNDKDLVFLVFDDRIEVIKEEDAFEKYNGRTVQNMYMRLYGVKVLVML